MFHHLRSYRATNTTLHQTATSTPRRRPASTAEAQRAESRLVVRWNRAITDLMRRGRCADARALFDRMPRRTTVSWNSLLYGYFLNRDLHSARKAFDEMPRGDIVSYNTLLHGLALHRDLSTARKLFEEMPHRDVVSWNTMISAYAHNGLVDDARATFDRAPVKNPVSWNGLLAAYLHSNRFDEALALFRSNPTWDTVSWNAMIDGHMRRRRTRDARHLFDEMPHRDVVSWNTTITGYAQNGQVGEARRLFDAAPHKDVFTWTAMLSGYAQNGLLDDARAVFDAMPERNAVSWNAMIAAYVKHGKMSMAKELFDEMPCKNISSWNAMLTGFAQNGDIDSARRVFDVMPRRDVISWSAMIAAYSQGGFSEEALHVFVEMQRSGESPNKSSFTCVLSTCADVAMLNCGRQLHGQLIKGGCEAGCFVGNALLAMYCKCGSIEDAHDAFCDISEKDVVTWNTMIAGYARHGLGNEALKVFDMMSGLETKPDHITLVAVLAACSHAGLIDRGMDYFYTMHEHYGITPKPEHYTCMIDILGRAGQLEEAYRLLKDMPFEPDVTMWGALLGASRKYGNTQLGEIAAERIFEMEPDDAGMYVLLSNLFAASGKWMKVDGLRVMMRDRGVRKVPGFSWIEVMNKIHTFSVGDSLHPEKDAIYSFLEELDRWLKKAGYKSSTKLVLHDVEEEEKEHMLRYHSEKLAIAYGILKIPPGHPIRVIKNLRVCEDCHSFIKHVSAMESRLIILRDNKRFHHFIDGSCSCGDYW